MAPASVLAAVEQARVSQQVRTTAPVGAAPAPVARENSELPPYTTAAKALVLDEASGAVLYQHGGEHAPAPPASLTKIVTAIVAIERGNLDRSVTVDVDSRKMAGSSLMGLRPGDQFTMRDLLYGLMLPSGNDAALAIGRSVGGTDAAFVEQMNGLMARLGLKDSHFSNPHGLAARDHYTSAYDLAMVSRYAMTLPEFREIVAATEHVARGSREIKMKSLIGGMLNWVPGVDGVKSGFTEQAGKTLVTSAVRDGRRVYVVVMNDPKQEIDSAELLKWAFDSYDWRPTAPPRNYVAAVAPPETTTPAAMLDADGEHGSASMAVTDEGNDIVRAARAD